MKPKAITFDFWGTLFMENPSSAQDILSARYEVLLDALSEAGTPADEGQVREAYRQAQMAFDDAWKALQVMTVYDRVGHIFKLLGVKFDEGLIALTARKLEETSLGFDLLPLPGVKEALPRLAKTHLLGIVCDTGVTPGRLLREHLRRHGLLHYFSGFSFSDETGAVKPRREAFMVALDELGVDPQNALHIGDIPRTDIAGAFGAGYSWAVQYTGHRTINGGPEPTARVKDHRELFRLLPEA
ncbi:MULTISPECIES: HAD family hydrolase [unclassified Meiothermus]|uniref:HAD family hydrolase n=1 Tax=unclassified Meiothermus TaxID=370471 RepID=UPI000D7C155E|nr:MULTISPECIES: HAD family hydrolase [unclassified Meiothermus]PZA08497.1 HAD family hydrolase [Meiothermus sp. Pnk-1]RYM36896.1 HAD family hydrolase [Meiothermus sp. PNK-Is4]